MNRYLLFDSSCEICSQMANEIEFEANGWLKTKSLHDPLIQQKLDAIKPNWTFEPMLFIEKDEGPTRVLNGFNMAVAFTFGVGLIKTTKILKKISAYNSLVSSRNNDQRRLFLKTTIPGVFGTLALFRLPKMQQNAINSGLNNNTEKPEIYHGFMILPNVDSELPPNIKDSTEDHDHSIDDHHHVHEHRVVKKFKNEKELRRSLAFPLYTVSRRFNNLPLISSLKVENSESNSTIEATITYAELAYNNSDDQTHDRRIAVSARTKPNYPSPFPIFPVHLDKTSQTPVAPQKIKVGKAFGLMLPSIHGHTAHWIEKGVLYTLSVEDSTDAQTMQQILNELVTEE